MAAKAGLELSAGPNVISWQQSFRYIGFGIVGTLHGAFLFLEDVAHLSNRSSTVNESSLQRIEGSPGVHGRQSRSCNEAEGKSAKIAISNQNRKHLLIRLSGILNQRGNTGTKYVL